MKQQQHDINLRRTRKKKKKNPSPRWDLNPRPSVIVRLNLISNFQTHYF